MAKKSEINVLVQNNLELQKVLIDLSANIKKMTDDMSNLTSIFKEASKTLSEEKLSKDMEKEDVKKIGEKIDGLSDQNKTIAKGLLLMESAMRENIEKKREF